MSIYSQFLSLLNVLVIGKFDMPVAITNIAPPHYFILYILSRMLNVEFHLQNIILFLKNGLFSFDLSSF